MKELVKAVVEFGKESGGGNKVTATVSLDEEVLTHLLKTDKLSACRKVVECIPELRDALTRIIEEKFFSSKTGTTKE